MIYIILHNGLKNPANTSAYLGDHDLTAASSSDTTSLGNKFSFTVPSSDKSCFTAGSSSDGEGLKSVTSSRGNRGWTLGWK